MSRFIIILVFLISLGSILYGQTCTEILQSAQRNFDDGLLEDIPDLLSGCMESGFTREEKANAYKLLIQTYIYSEDIINADKTMLDFLNDFPNYTLSAGDPKEFIDLYNTYDTDPVFNLEGSAGFLMSVPMLTENHSPRSVYDDPEEYYMGPGFAIELNYLKNLNSVLILSAGVSFLYSSMGYYSEPYDYTYLEATLYDMFVGVPISLRYHRQLNPVLSLEGKIGIEPAYLLSHTIDFSRTDDGADQPFQDSPDLTVNHNRIAIRPFVGIGARLDIGRDYISVSLNYKAGIRESLKEIYPDINFSERFLYHEDQMLHNHAIFLVSYMRPIYNPQKHME